MMVQLFRFLTLVQLLLLLASTTMAQTTTEDGNNGCTASETYNQTSETCDCLSGLSGWDCQMCIDDDSCHQIYEDENELDSNNDDNNNITKIGKCHQSFFYDVDVPNKTYGPCVPDPALQALYEGGAFDITCNQPLKQCQAALYIADHGLDGYHMIDCLLEGCNFQDGQADVYCDLITCQCGIHCSDIAKLTVETTLSGKPVQVTVDTSTKHIQMDVEGSFLPLGATCDAASSCYYLEQYNNNTQQEDIVTDDNELEEDPDENESDNKFQDDWKGAPAVAIIILFVIAFVVLLVFGCYVYFNIELRLARNSKLAATSASRSNRNGKDYVNGAVIATSPSTTANNSL